MSIVQAACILIGYELTATFFHLPTWTDLSHKPAGLPVWGFAFWLLIHLARGSNNRHRAVL